MEEGLHPVVKSARAAIDVSISYVSNFWDDYLRLYGYWRLQKPAVLSKSYSKISLNLFHSMVQEKIAKTYANAFSTSDHVSLEAEDPVGEAFTDPAQMWLRDLLTNKISIQHTIMSTLQSVMIGGSGFRMPTVDFVKSGGKWTRQIGCRNVDFFNVLPSPGGGRVNAFDNDNSNSLDWVFIIDWWSEDKLKALAKNGNLDEKAVGRMLDNHPDRNWPEEQYKNEYDEIGSVQYGGVAGSRATLRGVDFVPQKRRIVHWFLRDKWYIIGEDAFLLREADPPLGKGIIPLANYQITPDLSNFMGISYLQMIEDLVNATQMLFNYRMDGTLTALHPSTWIDDRILRGKAISSFRPRPFATHQFPGAQIPDISKAVFHDRGPVIPNQAWLEEDRMKAFLQKVAGMSETTSSLGDVVGNKTAGGTMAILSELEGRSNMESSILEYRGLREECKLLLLAAKKFRTAPSFVRTPSSKNEFPWSRIDPEVFQHSFTVSTHGTRYLSEKNAKFQKLLALYPYWNGLPDVWDTYELNKQTAEVADCLPNPNKALKPAQTSAPQPQPPQAEQRPGGLASSMDVRQGEESAGREAQKRSAEPTAAMAV